MVYPNNGWLQGMIQVGAAALVVVAFAVGCASPIAPEGGSSDASVAMVQTIGDVSVSRDGAESVIWLEGLIDPIYSVSASANSNLVIVDLVGVGKPAAEDLMGAVSDEARQIAAYDGVVDLISVATFDQEGDTPLTRVEIVMADSGRAEVLSTGDGLEIRIILGDEMMDVADETDSALGAEELPLWGSDTEFSEDTNVGLFDVLPPAATRLISLSAKVTDGGVLVSLMTDGGIGSLEAFTLADPARLVVDLPGLIVSQGITNIGLESDLVSAVRFGAHDDKVRIVLDGGPNANDFQGRQVMPGTTGLWIAIGTGEALESAMNEALEASESAWVASLLEAADDVAPEANISEIDMTPVADEEIAMTEIVVEEEITELVAVQAPEEVVRASFELAEVYGLHYERTEEMDRTAILADEAVPYTVFSPDATTLVVSLPGAIISANASDRIFPNAGGPISLVHAFQQPDVEVPEVRVVFTRAPNQEPIVSRRGSMIFVDFADMGIAAAAPPAFPNAGLVDTGGAPSIQAVDSIDSEMALNFDEDAMNTDEATGFEVQPVADTMEGEVDLASDTGIDAGLIDAIHDEAEVLPGFDNEFPEMDGPAAMAVAGTVWDAPIDAVAVPAAVEVPAAIEVLEEGGLIDGKEYRGRRVSLDFKDVEIADVLRLIAEVSDLNIISGDEVDGNVTIRLVEVPWDQALDVILMTKGLGFVRVGNVLRIAPSEVLKAEEELRLQERRNKEKLEDLEVKLMPVNYASVKDVAGLVKRLLSARGTVNLDERTNTLIIKDISSVIDEASALIAAIDTQTPQVMIEAKIVEANLDFSRELGSTWAIQSQQFVDPFDPDTPRTDLGGEDFRLIDQNSLAFANPITAIPNAVASMSALIFNQDFKVDVEIQAAESTGDGKVVSSPRIVTLDNKEAKIEQGVSIPFQTFEGGDAKLEFIDAVLSLIVTPHITADESIIMEIAVTRNAPDDSIATPTGSPAIAKNVAETEALVKDGQTLVLGGIYTITKSTRQSRVPYLHRIPVIGNLFKNSEITDARKELLVFVTPRIVRLPEMASN